MFEINDLVKIKSSGVVGTIIDKTMIGGQMWYIVESDTKGPAENAYSGEWAEYDCLASELVRLRESASA